MVCDPSPSPASCNSVERRLTQRVSFFSCLSADFPPLPPWLPGTLLACLQSTGEWAAASIWNSNLMPLTPQPSPITHRPSGQPPPVADNAIWAFCIASSGGSMSFYYYFYCAVIFCHPAPQKGQLAGAGHRQEKGQGQWPRQGAGVGGVHINAT